MSAEQKPQKLDKRGRVHKGGMPAGHKIPKTLEKEQAREALRAMVTAALEPMTHAMISSAKGIKFLMVREKLTGKFLKVGKDAAMKLNPDEEIIEVWEEKPNVQAYTDLLNRTLDKPTETIQANVTVSGLDERMKAGFERLKAARKKACND